jgi:hypothetical protein
MLRWVLFIFWTAFILYTMDILKPSEHALYGVITRFFLSLGLPAYVPQKLYHCGVFFVWSFLLAGALVGDYWRALPPQRLRTCVYSLIAFVAIPEGLQYFNPARSPALLDVGLNLFGGALGLCFRCAASRLIKYWLVRQR